MGLSAEQVSTTLRNDELWLIHNAHQTEQNPGEIIYRMAKNTGFQKKSEVTPEKKIETLQKGAEASKGLAAGSGSSAPTPEQIAAMSDDEFATFKAGLQKKGKRLSDVL